MEDEISVLTQDYQFIDLSHKINIVDVYSFPDNFLSYIS